jgi:hypothetical protein
MKDRSEIFLAGYFQNQEAVMTFFKNNVSKYQTLTNLASSDVTSELARFVKVWYFV